MRIGIIIHSHTGNTLSVGERLREALTAKGYNVQIERVTAVNEDPKSNEKIRLESVPDISPYDAVIIGAPVRAFSLSPVMKAYLAEIPQIQGKKVSCFVTEHFPKPWMGGNHAIKQILGLIAQKGGTVTCSGVINWSGKAREEQINDVISKLCKI
jgi:menaquinone-dependent protoporphyrinogen IX oxidase